MSKASAGRRPRFAPFGSLYGIDLGIDGPGASPGQRLTRRATGLAISGGRSGSVVFRHARTVAPRYVLKMKRPARSGASDRAGCARLLRRRRFLEHLLQRAVERSGRASRADQPDGAHRACHRPRGHRTRRRPGVPVIPTAEPSWNRLPDVGRCRNRESARALNLVVSSLSSVANFRCLLASTACRRSRASGCRISQNFPWSPAQRDAIAAGFAFGWKSSGKSRDTKRTLPVSMWLLLSLVEGLRVRTAGRTGTAGRCSSTITKAPSACPAEDNRPWASPSKPCRPTGSWRRLLRRRLQLLQRRADCPISSVRAPGLASVIACAWAAERQEREKAARRFTAARVRRNLLAMIGLLVLVEYRNCSGRKARRRRRQPRSGRRACAIARL